MGRDSLSVGVSSFVACFSVYICISTSLYVHPKYDQSSTTSDLLYLLTNSNTWIKVITLGQKLQFDFSLEYFNTKSKSA